MFGEQILNGLGIGCAYALIAAGYNVIFGVLKIVNLAYGEVFMAGAFSALVFARFVSPNPILMCLASIVGASITGLLVHFVAVKPLGNVSNVNSPRHLSVVVSTIGCSLVLQNLALEAFGGYTQPFPRFTDGFITVGRWHIEDVLIVNLLVTVLVGFTVSFLIRRTNVGLRLRAVSDNQVLAQSVGINVNADAVFSVVLSSALAGVAAILISQTSGGISPFMGSMYGFKGLVIVIVGGLGNTVGGILTALVTGLLEALTTGYISSSYRDAVAFGVLVSFIVARYSLTSRRR